MAPRRTKNTYTGPTKRQKYDVSSVSCVPDAESARSKNYINVEQVPQDDLSDLFTYCSLPIRCKLRRVCQRWKHVVSLPEVNEVALVNISCILVSNRNPPESWTRAGKRPIGDPYSKTDSLQNGWYLPWKCDSHEGNLSDHQRHGLLGPHVRTMIYDGDFAESKFDNQTEVQWAMKSIGYHCTNVRTIILWRIDQHGNYSGLRKDYFKQHEIEPTGLPQPETLMIVSSHWTVGYVGLPDSPLVPRNTLYPIKIRISTWTDLGQPDEEIIKRFLTCTPEQRAWVAENASKLPKSYKMWSGRFGIPVFRRGTLASSKLKVSIPKVDFDTLDVWHIRALAFCILRESMPGVEAPPQPFDDYVNFNTLPAPDS